MASTEEFAERLMLDLDLVRRPDADGCRDRIAEVLDELLAPRPRRIRVRAGAETVVATLGGGA
ncbi:MAG: hypothetical protein IT454_19180 [Planctomycetes bacterium]|nr:hypothetical protein [Planctomycetota bacterium]